ncbi:MAG: SDR family oxidoreductase [Oligoflexia bacterium]|nr:SDR family oxidoreductase [Oligoflexia bacterium]
MKTLITGGSSEIAQALARRRAAAGDDVCITASSRESLDATLADYSEKGIPARGFVFSLDEPEATDAEGLQRIREAEAIVLNAAPRIPKLKLFHEIPWEKQKAAIDSAVLGNLWLLKQALPEMKARRFGRLVFVSSLSVLTGTSRFGLYCSAKGALEALFVNLAVDYGEFGICANIVRPGIIATSRNRRYWKRSHFAEKMPELIPMRALGAPDQVAEALEPLLSPTTYMNGSTITVSGGLPMLRSQGALEV